MSGFLWAVLGIGGTFCMAAVGDMVSEEVRDRLDHLPHAILRLAALRLDPAQRVTVYDDEWLPELTYILKGDESRPVTRLYHGTRYALGILVAARRIARRLDRHMTKQPVMERDPDLTLYTPATIRRAQVVLLEGQRELDILERAIATKAAQLANARTALAKNMSVGDPDRSELTAKMEGLEAGLAELNATATKAFRLLRAEGERLREYLERAAQD